MGEADSTRRGEMLPAADLRVTAQIVWEDEVWTVTGNFPTSRASRAMSLRHEDGRIETMVVPRSRSFRLA